MVGAGRAATTAPLAVCDPPLWLSALPVRPATVPDAAVVACDAGGILADRADHHRLVTRCDVEAIADSAAFEAGLAEARLFGSARAGGGRHAVYQLPVGADDLVVGIEVAHPVRRIGPFAVAGLGRDIMVRVVRRDPVPIEIERLVEARRAIAVWRLAVEEAGIATREHADHDLLREGAIEDERAAGIAAGGDAFAGQRIVAPRVEIERTRLGVPRRGSSKSIQ